MPDFLHCVDSASGRTWRAFRSSLSDADIAAAAALLPRPPPDTGRAWLLPLGPPAAGVRLAVAVTSRAGAGLWRQLQASGSVDPAARPPPAPWCVILRAATADDIDAHQLRHVAAATAWHLITSRQSDP